MAGCAVEGAAVRPTMGAWLSSSGRRTLRSSAVQLGTETVYHPTTAMTDITAGLGSSEGLVVHYIDAAWMRECHLLRDQRHCICDGAWWSTTPVKGEGLWQCTQMRTCNYMAKFLSSTVSSSA